MAIETQPISAAQSSVAQSLDSKPMGNGIVRPTRGGVRFTTEQYLRMDRAGLFEDTRVELVLGRIYPMSPQADSHQLAISKGSRTLLRLFSPEAYWVVIQGTLLLKPKGAPEPDFHVFAVPEGESKVGHTPILVIEVSDSTYAHDSGAKLRQYASAAIADYWIVNIRERRVEVFRDPSPTAGKDGGWGYAAHTQYLPGASIAALAGVDRVVAVTDILP